MTLPARTEREAHDLALLTGDGAGEMLRVALGERATVRSWSVHSVHHRPGAGVTACYVVAVDVAGENGEIESTEEYMCASTARLSRPDEVLAKLQSQGTKVSIWRYPEDPELPGLAEACSPDRMSKRLGEPVSIELMSYRPTRRAVVKVSRPTGVMAFGKVLRLPQARDLAHRHRMLEASPVPAPRLLMEGRDGLVLIAAVTGEPLANIISRGMGVRAPQILRALIGALDALPAEAMSLPQRPAWADRAEHYAHAAATALPEETLRCRNLAQRIDALLAVAPTGPLVPVHGDFYEANIYMSKNLWQVSGLIDVDSIGPGYRVDDLACLLGHMSVLPHLAPKAYPHVAQDLAQWSAACEMFVDPVALNARCAGVVLSLIAGAKRMDGREWRNDALGRLATAEWWVGRAEGWAASRAVPGI
ncbi:aminoglycoside phosphotransferase family protein [Actinomycetaceae bacterium L2_0104]